MRSRDPQAEITAEFTQHMPRLRRYARTLAGPDQAEDLLQDCLERSWAKLDQWQPGTDLRAWMFTIMHNLWVDRIQKSQRIGFVEELDEQLAEIRPSRPDQALDMRDLERAFARLPDAQREVMLLVCVEDMSYAEVAELLGVPTGTIMSRLHRARESLRTWMQQGNQSTSHLRRIK